MQRGHQTSEHTYCMVSTVLVLGCLLCVCMCSACMLCSEGLAHELVRCPCVLPARAVHHLSPNFTGAGIIAKSQFTDAPIALHLMRNMRTQGLACCPLGSPSIDEVVNFVMDSYRSTAIKLESGTLVSSVSHSHSFSQHRIIVS
jgi:hypothetical protein